MPLVVNDINFQERHTDNYRSENADIKQGESQSIHPSIMDSQRTDLNLIYHIMI